MRPKKMRIEPRTHRPFIPGWLDDAGLPAQDHRVLSHLWRRAGKKGVCWPAAPSIARVCRLKVSTVWTCIARLEKAGLLARRKHFRNANEYRLTIPSIDPNGVLIQQIESVPQTDCQSTPLGHRSIDPFGAPPSAEREVPKEKCVCGTLTHSWPTAIPEEIATQIGAALHLSPATVREKWTAYRKRQMGYHAQCPSVEADIWDGFEGVLDGQRPKQERNNRAFERTQRDKFDSAVITFEPIPAPAGWQAIVEADVELSAYCSTKDWAMNDRSFQIKIKAIADAKH